MQFTEEVSRFANRTVRTISAGVRPRFIGILTSDRIPNCGERYHGIARVNGVVITEFDLQFSDTASDTDIDTMKRLLAISAREHFKRAVSAPKQKPSPFNRARFWRGLSNA